MADYKKTPRAPVLGVFFSQNRRKGPFGFSIVIALAFDSDND